MKIAKTILSLAAFAIAAIGAAFAGEDFSEEKVARFIETLEKVQPLADRMAEEGKEMTLSDKINPVTSGEFDPYSNAVTALEAKYPSEHKELARLVKPFGFSPEEWGQTGDRVLAAYMALKMAEEPGMTAGIAQMDPSMLEMMPPEAKAQFAGVMKMVEKIENVPSSDKNAVAPNAAALEAYMESAPK